MKPRKIVIFTQRFDLDADAIILRLRAMGQLPVRVNSDAPPEETYFSLRLSGDGCSGRLRTRNREIDLGDGRSAYWRAPASWRFFSEVSASDGGLACEESNHAWHGLWATQDCYWINHPDQVRQSRWRPKQLKAAGTLGFQTPRTLVTSQPDEAVAFCEECGGRLVFRLMSDPLVNLSGEAESPTKPTHVIHPMLVTLAGLKEHAAEIGNIPCFFQEYVERSLEFRIAVVGEEVFAAEIDSKAPLRLPSDWQSKDALLTLKKGSLPGDLPTRCLLLSKEFGFHYAVIDLLRKPDGQYVFLEINPNGHFLPIERRVPELKITDALAACLLRASGSA